MVTSDFIRNYFDRYIGLFENTKDKSMTFIYVYIYFQNIYYNADVYALYKC